MDSYADFAFIYKILRNLIIKCDDEDLKSQGITALILIDDLVDMFFPIIEDMVEKDDLL